VKGIKYISSTRGVPLAKGGIKQLRETLAMKMGMASMLSFLDCVRSTLRFSLIRFMAPASLKE
jgi:hypothetical protein